MNKTKVNEFSEQLDKDLVESKKIFEVIFENSQAAIFVLDNQGCIIACNPMVEKILGMTTRDLFNKPLSCLFSPEEFKRISPLHKRTQGSISNIRTKAVRKDGTAIDVDLLLNGSVAILQGITENKQVDTLILKAKAIAEEANAAKSVFLAQTSHEIRTPLNAIMSMIDLTLETPLNEEQRDNLQIAKDAADNLLSLINDVLDLSRAQAGKVVVEKIEINVADIVKNVCKGLMILARNKGVDIVWSIDPELPRILIGDPVRLRQVIVNLVNNAIKFTHKGKVQVNVTRKTLTDRECEVVFEVIDSGIGIPAANLPHIFEVFTDVQNTTARRYGGTGLGLAICKKVVQMMGGSIHVQTKEGTGTTFCFNVIFGFRPQLLSNAKGGENTPADHGPAIPDRLKNLRILLAEDNVVNQRIIVKILEKVGWEVTAVYNGQEVLNILNNQTFDVILMDDKMPLLSGIEVTRIIRREEKHTGQHVPIIATTANAMTGDKEKYLSSGMDGYISKPIDRQLLFQEIINLVSQRLNN